MKFPERLFPANMGEYGKVLKATKLNTNPKGFLSLRAELHVLGKAFWQQDAAENWSMGSLHKDMRAKSAGKDRVTDGFSPEETYKIYLQAIQEILAQEDTQDFAYDLFGIGIQLPFGKVEKVDNKVVPSVVEGTLGKKIKARCLQIVEEKSVKKVSFKTIEYTLTEEQLYSRLQKADNKQPSDTGYVMYVTPLLVYEEAAKIGVSRDKIAPGFVDDMIAKYRGARTELGDNDWDNERIKQLLNTVLRGKNWSSIDLENMFTFIDRGWLEMQRAGQTKILKGSKRIVTSAMTGEQLIEILNTLPTSKDKKARSYSDAYRDIVHHLTLAHIQSEK